MQAHSRCMCLPDTQPVWLRTQSSGEQGLSTRAGHDPDMGWSPYEPHARRHAGPTMEPGSVENLSIVYQSRDFLVVNKHWDVHIDSKTWRETLTLQKQLRRRFPDLADPGTCYGFRYLGVRPREPQAAAAGGKWPPLTRPLLSLCSVPGSATSWISPPAGHSAWP